jgi:hypothetical protein
MAVAVEGKAALFGSAWPSAIGRVPTGWLSHDVCRLADAGQIEVLLAHRPIARFRRAAHRADRLSQRY